MLGNTIKSLKSPPCFLSWMRFWETLLGIEVTSMVPINKEVSFLQMCPFTSSGCRTRSTKFLPLNLNSSIWIWAAQMLTFESLHSCTTLNVQWCNCRERLHRCSVGVLRSVGLACIVTKALPRMLWWRQVTGHNHLRFSVAWPSWLLFCLL